MSHPEHASIAVPARLPEQSSTRMARRLLAPRRAQRIATAMLAATMLVLAACSIVRTAYNQAANLAYWQLNRAFHFDDEQAEQVRRDLNAFLAWHRREELPAYVPVLARGAREAQGSISAELACERRAEAEKIGRRSIEQAVPMLARMLRSLRPEQIGHLQEFMADFNEDFRDDFLQEDKADRDEAYGDFAVKWAEFFYGKFSKAQRAALARGVVTGPLTPYDAYNEIQRVQGEFVQIARLAVHERAPQAQVEQALRTMFLHVFEPPTPERRARLASWINAGCALAASTHAGTTQAQRDKVTARLTDWEKDVRILAAQR